MGKLVGPPGLEPGTNGIYLEVVLASHDASLFEVTGGFCATASNR
jgi:hypothetical protein